MSEEAFPLAWPAGWPRAKRKARSSFGVSFADARDDLMRELRLMGASYPVLSSNVPLRRDGLPYAATREPDDPGVAVYFMWQGKQMTFACDRWDRVKDNVRAIGKTIEALRGIERWGASDMMQRAFSAFEALPAPDPWWKMLGLTGPTRSKQEINEAYRKASGAAHPDRPGGSHDRMAQVNAARDEALKLLA